MNRQDNSQPNSHQPVIEDLTIDEVQSDAVKGGPTYRDSFSFGVEREMKESG
jgi:hypothetical protein